MYDRKDRVKWNSIFVIVVGTSAFDSSQIVVESRSNFVKTDHTTFKCPSRHGVFFRIFQTIRFAADATRERTASRNEVEEFRESRGCGEQFPGTSRGGGAGILFKAEHFTVARSTLVMENLPATPRN